MTGIIDLRYPGKVEADVPGSGRNLSLNCLGRRITGLFHQSTPKPERYATRLPLNVQLEIHAPRIPQISLQKPQSAADTHLPYGSAKR